MGSRLRQKNMKVILSKKGFDSSYGQQSSIILPQKYGYKMISFPIPETNSNNAGVPSENINYIFKDEKPFNLKDLFNQLDITNKIKFQEKSKTRIFTENKFHLDPEVFITSEIRKKQNYAAFGQSGPAAGALLDKSDPLEKDDVFLFFGTFQRTFINNGKITYDDLMNPIHALWGYMIVDDIIHINKDMTNIDNKYIQKYPDIENHLHFINRANEGDNNIIICGKRFGTFSYDEKYRLTKPDYQKTCWSISDAFKKANMKYLITEKKDRIILDPKRILANGIGQEFVTSNFDEEEMKKWLKGLGVPL